jgi:hypothetical protein
MKQSKDEWRRQLESQLPPKSQIIERNKAITAMYAKWYLDHPAQLKWAGMAAFASYQVGVALAFAELLSGPDQMMGQTEEKPAEDLLSSLRNLYTHAVHALVALPVALHDYATRQLLLNDLTEIKNGNDEIFNDIAWAHAAYVDCGIKEVEQNVSENEKEYMLKGFQMIDQGARKLQAGPKDEEAWALIGEGNVKLLRHEQLNTLQPIFDRISPTGKVIVSFGSTLDFTGALVDGQNNMASFSEHFGNVSTLSGQKSVTNPEDRWAWIEGNVLPIWRRVDCSYCEESLLKQRLKMMAAKEPTMLQNVTQFANTIYPIIGMKPEIPTEQSA